MTVNFDALNAERITESIKHFSRENLITPYTSKISCFETIDSTNTWLLEFLLIVAIFIYHFAVILMIQYNIDHY